MVYHNWSSNLTYSTEVLHTPSSIDEIQAIIGQASQVKALGSRHSFNRIADSSEVLISLAQFDEITLDTQAQTVTVGAGVRYGELAHYLHQNGYALHNLASLPHISVVGACATATHGSGIGNGNLATSVRGMRWINGKGEQIELNHHDAEFAGAVVHLGALGVITTITLAVQPTFTLGQHVYLDLSLEQATTQFNALMSTAYSVSLFTDWRNDRINQVWLKTRDTASPPPTLGDATLAQHAYHPIASVSPENCTEQLGVHGAWHERLPHFRLEFTPSNGAELQSEYFVAREHAPQALESLYAIRERFNHLLLISEIRCIAGDDLWMSPCYQSDCVGLHFTWERNVEAVEQVLPSIEEALAPFEPRPHWGKLFTLPMSAIQSGYPQLNAFRKLAQTHDPDGKFRNRFLDDILVV
ncbi:MAG: FAD-binding protein [Anaerolineae bacterium]